MSLRPTQKPPESEPKGIGLSLEEAEERLMELSPSYFDLIDELKILAVGPNGTSSDQYKAKAAELELLRAQMDEVRDWYMLRVMELLNAESGGMKKLTLVLVLLTAVLAVLTGVLAFRTFF